MNNFFNILISTLRTTAVVTPTDNPIMIVMVGESNAGGQVSISSASTLEKTENPDVQLLDVLNLDKFYNLHLGVNQNLGHSGLNNTTFGWHNQIGNRMREGTFVPSPLYLVETGQGGSRLNTWASGEIDYVTFTQRVSAAISLIEGSTGKSPDIYYLYTHGINDVVSGVTAAEIKPLIIDLWDRIMTTYGGIKILSPELMNGFATEPTQSEYKQMFLSLENEIPNFHIISSEGASLDNIYHWSYQGMNLLADRMMDNILGI